MKVSERCICTVVRAKALAAILEGTGAGSYRDTHPWLIAQELLCAAAAATARLAVLFATGEPAAFSHWAFVKSINVRELHKGAWETCCTFEPLQRVNPIWEALDSVSLAPSAEQLRRERLEPVRNHRQALDMTLIHPYAVCETPAFIGQPRCILHN